MMKEQEIRTMDAGLLYHKVEARGGVEVDGGGMELAVVVVVVKSVVVG